MRRQPSDAQQPSVPHVEAPVLDFSKPSRTPSPEAISRLRPWAAAVIAFFALSVLALIAVLIAG